MNLFKLFLHKEPFEIPNLGQNVPPEPQVPDHKHEFDLIAKTYAKPAKEAEGKGDFPEKFTEKVFFGVTTLLWKCVLCSETKKEEVLGTDESDLDDLLEKANTFGPQYIQKDGQTYVIGKWQSAQQPQSGNIPLK